MPEPGATAPPDPVAALDAQLAELRRLIAVARALVPPRPARRDPPPDA